MAGTFLCPSSCGFAKVVAVEITRKVETEFKNGEKDNKPTFRASLHQEQYNQYKEIFKDVWQSFEIDYTKFIKKLPTLRAKFNKWNYRLTDQKAKYMKTFSTKNWNCLPLSRKREHSFENCKSCAVRFTEVQSFFPVKSNVLKGKAMNNPVFSANQQAESLRGTVRKTVPSQKEAKATAAAYFNSYASSFQETYNMPLAKALSKVPGIDIQNKTPNEIHEDRRNHYRKSKKSTQKQMEETAFIR